MIDSKEAATKAVAYLKELSGINGQYFNRITVEELLKHGSGWAITLGYSDQYSRTHYKQIIISQSGEVEGMLIRKV